MATVTVQLRQELAASAARIAELEKQLASEKNAKDTWYKCKNDVEAELEQVHQILDSLPNPPPRKSKHEESWRQTDLSLTARFATWLASR